MSQLSSAAQLLVVQLFIKPILSCLGRVTPSAVYKKITLLHCPAPSWPLHYGGGIALSSRHQGRSKNLRYHIFNYKHEAERKVEIGLDYELSNPTTSYVLPLARLYLPNLPNSSTHWDPRIQMLESMRDISHLSYHSDQTQKPALYHWYIYQDLYHYFVNDYCMIVK